MLNVCVFHFSTYCPNLFKPLCHLSTSFWMPDVKNKVDNRTWYNWITYKRTETSNLIMCSFSENNFSRHTMTFNQFLNSAMTFTGITTSYHHARMVSNLLHRLGRSQNQGLRINLHSTKSASIANAYLRETSHNVSITRRGVSVPCAQSVPPYCWSLDSEFQGCPLQTAQMNKPFILIQNIMQHIS